MGGIILEYQQYLDQLQVYNGWGYQQPNMNQCWKSTNIHMVLLLKDIYLVAVSKKNCEELMVNMEEYYMGRHNIQISSRIKFWSYMNYILIQSDEK